MNRIYRPSNSIHRIRSQVKGTCSAVTVHSYVLNLPRHLVFPNLISLASAKTSHCTPSKPRYFTTRVFSQQQLSEGTTPLMGQLPDDQAVEQRHCARLQEIRCFLFYLICSEDLGWIIYLRYIYYRCYLSTASDLFPSDTSSGISFLAIRASVTSTI